AKRGYDNVHTKRQNGLNLVHRSTSHLLFILGKTGAVKTTFLKYITLQALRGNIERIPIFVSLKAWSDSDYDLFTFITRQFDACSLPNPKDFVKYLLDTGLAIVLFDGLDEINQTDDQQSKSIKILEDFSKKYNRTQCLITCRIAATDYFFDHFTYVEIADFNNEQIDSFVDKWYKDNPEVRDKFKADIDKPQNQGLKEIGRVPLLLTLLCLAFEEMLTFPQRRVEIYEEAIDALLKKWDSSRKIKRDDIYRKLSLGRKRQLLARLAIETFSQGEYFFPQRDLEYAIVDYLRKLPPVDIEEDIDGESILKAIEAQHGIFVERARKIHSFSHLTFQEYFTARYIVDNGVTGTWHQLLSHVADNRWREVFLLTVSLLDDADAFFSLFREALDLLIVEDETLAGIIQLVGNKEMSLRLPFKGSIVRSLYLFIELFGNYFSSDNDFGLDSTLENAVKLILTLDGRLSDVLTRVVVRYPDRYGQLNLALESCKVHSPGINNRLAFDLDLIFALRVSIFFSRFPGKLTKPLLSRFTQYIKEIVKLSRRIPSSNSHRELKSLSVPTSSSQETWRIFSDEFRSVIINSYDIGHKWSLTPEQFKQFSHYVGANVLFVECLQLAFVADRESIEETILLPV
ncbi:MAG: NACHT domain-containing protein, partial [Candidatus Hodarchaeota archaeon]